MWHDGIERMSYYEDSPYDLTEVLHFARPDWLTKIYIGKNSTVKLFTIKIHQAFYGLAVIFSLFLLYRKFNTILKSWPNQRLAIENVNGFMGQQTH